MAIILDKNIPRYHQIFLLLRERILTQKVLPGERIASEVALSREFGVSRITSRRALIELERAGLVTRERGRGTHVRENVIPPIAADSALEKFAVTDRVIGQSRIIGQSEVRLLSFSRQTSSSAAAQALGLAPGSDVYVVERVRLTDGEPFCHVTAYVPLEIGHTFSPAALESSMLIDLIQVAGRPFGTAEQTVSATIADMEVASHLNIRAGSPLLYLNRTVFDTDGTAIEYVSASFRSDKFRLSMTLEQSVPVMHSAEVNKKRK